MARSLNKVSLIGNLTRDPELRYTPQGTAVCTFGLATNRQWTTETGERKEDAEFHRIVSWNKLAELCAQLLGKGRKVYVEGRLQTRKWTGQDEVQRTTTEIVISDMIILDSRRVAEGAAGGFDISEQAVEEVAAGDVAPGSGPKKPKKKGKKARSAPASERTAKPKSSSEKKPSKKEEKKDDEDMPF